MRNKTILFLVLILQLITFADSYSDIGDKEFANENYKQAVSNYEKSQDRDKKIIKFKLLKSYIQLGDNFASTKQYKTSLYWYKKATNIDKNAASFEISKVYEQLGNRYESIHNYEKALQFYEKALSVRDKTLQKRIKHVSGLIEHKEQLKTDTRKLVTKSSPVWTHSVGRLISPTKLQFVNEKKYQTKRQNCSATLVNLETNKDSNIIITAAHCIQAFDKTIGDLKFIIKGSSGDMIHRIGNIEFQSNFDVKKLKKTTDFAILSLDEPISYNEVKPLIIKKTSFINLQKNSVKNYASLVGFSSDIQKYGAKLTYDPICQVKKYTQMYGSSTCSGFNGASGGPIILSTTDKKKKIQYHFIGVVSHFKNKEFTNIFFAPHHLHFQTIKKIIEKFN